MRDRIPAFDLHHYCKKIDAYHPEAMYDRIMARRAVTAIALGCVALAAIISAMLIVAYTVDIPL